MQSHAHVPDFEFLRSTAVPFGGGALVRVRVIGLGPSFVIWFAPFIHAPETLLVA